MADTGNEGADAVLSDVEEGDDSGPIMIKNPAPEDVSVEKVMKLLPELDRERQARQAAENSKSELQVSFNRLKALAHEAIKKRDEFGRQRDDALLEKEEALKSYDKVLAELYETNKAKDEVLRQRDEISKQFDEVVKERDDLRLEIGNSTHMFVTGIEKISAKVGHFKYFAANELPKSQRYSGLAAVAYGVIKRANDIVEELVKQIDATTKSRNETRERMEQRNYEISKQFDEVVKERDDLRLEIGNSTHMFVTGIEKISAKVGHFKYFAANELPKSQRYSGLAAVAYGVIKRANDIVEELVKQIDATTKSRNETRERMEQRNYEISKQFDEVVKERDDLRLEIGNSTHMFVTGIEKISAKVGHFKYFAANELPKSQRYSGLAAVAYGVIKRANDIVEELVKQIDATTKSRNETRERMEPRNYEISKQFDEVVKERDDLRLEIGNSTHMFVTGIEKISAKVGHFKYFAANELPKSQRYSGLAAVAYGVIKRANDIVEELVKQIDATTKSRNETRERMEQRNYEISKQFDEVVKERDDLRLEIGNSTHMFVTGIEKISAKVGHFKYFAANELPKSQRYSGLAAVAYGVIKRANDIVEELVKQIDATTKSRNETRERMEQRNYEIAIEVSQLEQTISELREEVEKKNSDFENLERTLEEKDKKINEVEQEMSEKLSREQNEVLELRQLVREYDEKLSKLSAKMESHRPLLIDQLSFVSKIHNQIYNVMKIIDANNSELSESFFVPQETDIEENIRASLAGMESIYELTKIVVEKTRDVVKGKNHEIRTLNDTVTRLVREKDQIGSLLRRALSKRMASDTSSKKSELFQAAEKGLRDAGLDFKFSKLLGDEKYAASNGKLGITEKEEDEIYSLASALENVVKASQIEIIELQHTVDELRAELSLLKQHVEAQTKELIHRMHRIQELEDKKRVANESVEGLMMDVAVAEEEINRWKLAAEQEAAAGRAVEQEFVAELQALKQELEDAKQSMLESENKVKFKEETTAAAMEARDAAEKSLRLADLRASRLRDRVEELTRQLEELENREDLRGRTRSRYVCWPWQWLGLDFVGSQRPDTQEQNSNEMELSEPLL